MSKFSTSASPKALVIAAVAGLMMAGPLSTGANAAKTESCLSLAKTPDNKAAAQPADPTPSAADRALSKAGNDVDQHLGPNKPLTKTEMHAAVPVKAIENPAQSLSTAEIKNCGGESIGTVKSVDVSPDGTARAIRISSGGFLGLGDRVISIDADRFAYLKERNLLITDLSKDQIKAMAMN